MARVATMPAHIVPAPTMASSQKQIMIAPQVSPQTSTSTFTRKEWIVPPRPKPGRKPAGDAPPTKRKAQNREAQRAFRERRAAKVGELEVTLKEVESQCRQENILLTSRLEGLERDLNIWQTRYFEMERSLETEMRLRKDAELEVQSLRRGLQAGTEAVPLPPRRSAVKQATAPLNYETSKNNTRVDTCGRCVTGSRCLCIDEAFEMRDIIDESSDIQRTKRASSPHESIVEKKSRTDYDHDHNSNEIDFTAMFSSQPSKSDRPRLRRPADTCGFCSDESNCICAAILSESEAQLAGQTKSDQQSENATFQDSNSKSPNSSKGGCTSNPGSCKQCRADPTSTLFCKTLASTRPKQNGRTITSQPLQITDSNQPHGTDKTLNDNPPVRGPTLSCAEAYSKLSRHHAFPQARSEIGSWVSQLTAVPGTTQAEGKTAFEIEAASVMSVIKFFDTRFGRDSGTIKR